MIVVWDDDQAEIAEIIGSLRSQGTDTRAVEVKAAAGGFPKKLVRSISAFANGTGGIIILGLDEDNGFVPVPGFDATAMADVLAGACADLVTPSVRAQIDIVEWEGASIVVGTIPECAPFEKPCWVVSRSKYHGSYIRVHDGDRVLKPYEIDRLEENKTQPEWDLEPVPDADIDDLDPDIVAEILARERSIHERIFGRLSDEEAMLALHLITRNDNGKLVPTLGGLMAAGTYPQQFFPRLNVTFAAYPGTDKSAGIGKQRFLDNESLVGPIPVLVADAVRAVRRNMRVGGVIEGVFRKDLPDYPPEAVREAVANALMHRDYSPQARGTQVQVNLYVDRLEILNPGGLYGTVTVDRLGTAGMSSARNQHLSALLEVTPAGDGDGYVAENRGSGYIEILDQLERQLLPPPVPRDSLTEFELTFARRNPTTPERTAALGGGTRGRVLDYLREHRTASSRELAAAAGLSLNGVRRTINELVEEGVIVRTEPLKSPKQRYRLQG
ncbi:ATP-binding protein [Corynebacterium striatum]